MRLVISRRAASRLPLLAFVFALVLKGAVPMLASWSAQLQGKSVAEVCDVYGVALPSRDSLAPAREHAMHGLPLTGDAPAADEAHAMHAMHSMHAASMSHAMHATHAAPSSPSGDGPHRRDTGSHAGDHCVLGALVAFAGVASLAAGFSAEPARGETVRPPRHAHTLGADASARWAALVGHGPPAFS